MRNHGKLSSSTSKKAIYVVTAILLLAVCGLRAYAQSVQPVIVEYKGKADGKFAVTNNTLEPMVAVLEPRSFSITPEGKGQFRSLDPGIQVELSSMSLRLAPNQTSYVFYKASAIKLPAWFTVYATFSPVKHSAGLDVRVMLPHTVYLYQKNPMVDEEVRVTSASFSPKSKMLTFDIQNDSEALGRVQEVHASSSHGSVTLGGFPLLPGGIRHLQMAWTEKDAPVELAFRFDHFTVKQAVSESVE